MLGPASPGARRPGRVRPALAGRRAAFRVDRPAPDAAPGVLLLPDRHRARFPLLAALLLLGGLHRRAPVHRQPAAPRDHGRRRSGGPRPTRRFPRVAVGRGRAGRPPPTSRGSRPERRRPGPRGSSGRAFSSTATTSGSPSRRSKARTVRLLRPERTRLAVAAAARRSHRLRVGRRVGDLAPGGLEHHDRRTSRSRPACSVGKEAAPTGDEAVTARRRRRRPPGTGLWSGEWVHAFYLETALNAVGREGRDGQERRGAHGGRPRRSIVVGQLFAQGVDEIGGVFRIAFFVIARDRCSSSTLVALADRLRPRRLDRPQRQPPDARHRRRSPAATSPCASSSKSRDQIGDLARSFDGMAASIERLLSGHGAQGAARERDRDRPHDPAQAAAAARGRACEGVSVLAHFEPVAEIGGDYYDYLPMPDGRLAFALGDVSGHGLPTGLLVAMAKAGLSTLVEAGHDGRRALRAAERAHPPLDGPAPLHDARASSPTTPATRAGDADQRRAARSVPGLGRRPRGALAARPSRSASSPARRSRPARALLRGRRPARLLHATASSRRSTRRTRPSASSASRPCCAPAPPRAPRPCATRSSPPSRPTPATAPADDDRTLLILTLD